MPARYVTCAAAIGFANDLKIAHYVKIPPRQTFTAQVVATVFSTFIYTALLNYQMNEIPNVCTKDAPNGMSCPTIHTFFTASVLWGTLGPKKMFGVGGQYTVLMAAWPIGALIPVVVWLVRKRFPGQKWMRQISPVVFLSGALNWAPYNLSYVITSVWLGWLSWIWCKNRYLDFWSKYNFVTSAGFSCGIALTGIIIFFALDSRGVALNWWGNDVIYQGCEDTPCVLLPLEPGEHFGPGLGDFH